MQPPSQATNHARRSAVLYVRQPQSTIVGPRFRWRSGILRRSLAYNAHLAKASRQYVALQRMSLGAASLAPTQLDGDESDEAEEEVDLVRRPQQPALRPASRIRLRRHARHYRRANFFLDILERSTLRACRSSQQSKPNHAGKRSRSQRVPPIRRHHAKAQAAPARIQPRRKGRPRQRTRIDDDDSENDVPRQHLARRLCDDILGLAPTRQSQTESQQAWTLTAMPAPKEYRRLRRVKDLPPECWECMWRLTPAHGNPLLGHVRLDGWSARLLLYLGKQRGFARPLAATALNMAWLLLRDAHLACVDVAARQVQADPRRIAELRCMRGLAWHLAKVLPLRSAFSSAPPLPRTEPAERKALAVVLVDARSSRRRSILQSTRPEVELAQLQHLHHLLSGAEHPGG